MKGEFLLFCLLSWGASPLLPLAWDLHHWPSCFSGLWTLLTSPPGSWVPRLQRCQAVGLLSLSTFMSQILIIRFFHICISCSFCFSKPSGLPSHPEAAWLTGHFPMDTTCFQGLRTHTARHSELGQKECDPASPAPPLCGLWQFSVYLHILPSKRFLER